MNQHIELIEPTAVNAVVLDAPSVANIVPRASAVSSPADLLRIAMERGDKIPIEMMERMMTMQERFEEAQERERKRQAELEFRRDFAEFKGENIAIPKTKKVQQRGREGKQGPSYDQTELHVVAGLLQPALSRHGFGYRFDVKFTRAADGGIAWCIVTCKLEHRAGHVEVLTLEGPPDDSGAKNPLQEMQSSATFLMRHSLMAITGTAQAGMDNDGRGARGQESEAEAPSEELLQAGRDASMLGMKPLTAWWGALAAQEREALTHDFKQMREAARMADQKGAQ
jgi:hypothetical protein